MAERKRKALSPLIATAILLSAAMAGGVLLYQYFNTAMSKYIQGESIILSTLAEDTGTGKTLLYYSVKNTGTSTIKLVKLEVYKGESLVSTLVLNSTQLSPGDTQTGTAVIDSPPSNNMYAILTINVNGKELVMKPVAVTLS